MKRIQVLLLFIVISCSMFAQDRLSLFIGRANKYAAVELSDYRKRLCVEYNISNQLLDDYYRRCGSNWGNVGLALEIAKTSGRHMREVCDYYKRYHRNGWNRILVEIGIKSSRLAPLLGPSPLRTVHESFPSHGSSNALLFLLKE